MTGTRQLATGVALTALLLTGAAVPAIAVSPTATVADCTTAKDQAKDAAKAAFKDAKKLAWTAYAASDAPGAAAAKERRVALRTARLDRKSAFIDARKAFTSCMATATTDSTGGGLQGGS